MHIAVRALMPYICPWLLGVEKGTHRDLAHTQIPAYLIRMGAIDKATGFEIKAADLLLQECQYMSLQMLKGLLL